MKLKLNRKFLIVSLGAALLAGGLIMLLILYRSQANSIIANPNVLANAAPVKHSPAAISGDPVSIQIPSLGTDLKVTPGVYDAQTQQWTLTLDKVQYATMTPKPNNESGNTFMYGHYRRNVFANLHTIKMGAQAVVKTSNGHTFYYHLTGAKVVNPQDSAEVFNYRGKPMLTVQTCTGLFFQNRQLFFFQFDKVV
ncbi:MAG TPA: class F sortase [Candidatus Saccharimonadales bacterium]|nr:class F sortase [Candidatus Saccharimonadales bacterium]